MKKTFAAAGLLALAFTQSAQALNMNTDPQPPRSWSYAGSCVGYMPWPDKESVVRLHNQPFTGTNADELLAEDPYEMIFALRYETPENKDARSALIKTLTLASANAAVDFAFDRDSDKDATLRQTRTALKTMLQRLPDAGTNERARIHKDAYDLRVTLERRDFAAHYVEAAYAVAMAASRSPSLPLHGPNTQATGDAQWVALYLTAKAMEYTMTTDLGRVLKRDLRRPSEEIQAAAERQGLIQSCDNNRWWGDASILSEMGRQDALHRSRDVIYNTVKGMKP